MKEKSILFGPFIGEMGWEILRFSALIPYYKKHHPNHKFIIFTRPDRFDLYGENADIFIPLRINEDSIKYKADCYRLMNFPIEEYKKLVNKFYKQFSTRFEISKHIYPDITGKRFANKNQFPQNQMKFKWKPRIENKIKIDSYISNDKPCIVISPRFRDGMRRNWPHWNELYNLIYNSDLYEKYNFVLCGKYPDYIPDEQNRFYDINKIELNDDISLIGLTMEIIKKSVLTIGSQSGIPNLSAILETPVLEWGHQKVLHSNTYNIKKTPIHFIEDMKYNLDPKIIFEKLNKILKK